METRLDRKMTCRSCGAGDFETFADLGTSPISNAFLSRAQLCSMEPTYPLHAFVCKACWLVQLDEFESPEQIFNENYAYFSSYTKSWLAHARAYVEQVADRFRLTAGSLAVELASNDGYLLQYFKEKGIPVLGVEPSGNVAEAALKKGIPTVVKFFGAQTASFLLHEGHAADLITANNVFAHVPDVNDFVKGMKILLKKQGVVTVEFPHLLSQIRHGQFDTIYHEHFSYFSLISAAQIFERQGLRVFDVEELSTHGGSLRLFVCHTENSALEPTLRLSAWCSEEEKAGLRNIETYRSFQRQVVETKSALLEFLIAAKRQGKKVAGYGAPAKGNTLLNYCGIRTDFLDFTVDRSEFKQGKFLPGTRIPILAPEAIRDAKPDYLLILPWNIREEVISQMGFVREWGGKFVTPIPRVSVE